MKSLPEHACDECNELIKAIAMLKHQLQQAKRKPLNELPAELNALQADAGALEQRARDMKTFVTVAFVNHAPREPSDELREYIDQRSRQLTGEQPFQLSAA